MVFKLFVLILSLQLSAMAEQPQEKIDESPCLEVQKYPGSEDGKMIQRCKSKKNTTLVPQKSPKPKKKKTPKESSSWSDKIFKQLGLIKGDVVQKVNDISVNSQSEAEKALNSLKNAEQFTIEVVRENKKKILNYKVDKKEGHP